MYTQTTQGAARAVRRQTPDEFVLQGWLVTRIAELSDQPETDIDIEHPFSAYALDSVATVGLTGELQEWLEINLPATLLWDYPSIESLARYLATRDDA